MTFKSCFISSITLVSAVALSSKPIHDTAPKAAIDVLRENFVEFKDTKITGSISSKDTLSIILNNKKGDMDSEITGLDTNRDKILQASEVIDAKIRLGTFSKKTFTEILIEKSQANYESFRMSPDFAAQETNPDGSTTFYGKAENSVTHLNFEDAVKFYSAQLKKLTL
jgi:hypothetical protein